MKTQTQWLFDTPAISEVEQEFNSYQGDLEGVVSSVFGKIENVLSWGKEQYLVRKAILAGNRNRNQLTNLVFFIRYPERQGRKLSPSEPNFQPLSQEWLEIRDRLVQPILDSSTSGIRPSPPGSGCVQIDPKKAPAIIRKLALAVERMGTLPGFATFAVAVAYTESRYGNCEHNPDDATAACRLYQRNIKERTRYTTNPFPEADWCFGSGGWFGLIPASGLAAGGKNGVFANANPRLVHDQIASVVMLADFVYRIVKRYHAKNWLAVRRGMASPGLVATSSSKQSQEVRDRFAEALKKSGVSNPEQFMEIPVSIQNYPGAAQLLKALRSQHPEIPTSYGGAEGESEGVFSNLSARLKQGLSRSQEEKIIRQAISAGLRDANTLTNQVFFHRYPHRQGQKLKPNEPNFRQLSQEWIEIRDRLVLPLLKQVSSGQSPGTSAQAPSKTPWLSALVPLLNRYRGDIPLDFLLGWIATESGGRIGVVTNLDERGYFQIHPGESKMLKLDHQRLSSNRDYSIQSGIKLVKHYAKIAQTRYKLQYGTDLFWHVVKLLHWLPGGVKLILNDIQSRGMEPTTWDVLKQYVTDNLLRLRQRIKTELKGSWNPLKGIANVDKVFNLGKQLVMRLPSP